MCVCVRELLDMRAQFDRTQATARASGQNCDTRRKAFIDVCVCVFAFNSQTSTAPSASR